MPKLDPEAARIAECEARGHGELEIEWSEPEVGFVGYTKCSRCETTLGVDLDPPRHHRRQWPGQKGT